MHVSHRLANAFVLLPLVAEIVSVDLTTLVEDLICMKLLPWLDMDRTSENEQRLNGLASVFASTGFVSVSNELAEMRARSSRRFAYLE